MVNTNRVLVDFVGSLLRKLAIRSRVFLERKHHRMWSKLPCYHLTTGWREDQKRFAISVGFGIQRKQEKLLIALSLLDSRGPSGAVPEWQRLYEKHNQVWVKVN
jgi:hypothetical protein